MTIQDLIDLLNTAEDKTLEVLIKPCSNCERHNIFCVDFDNGGAVLYMEENAN